MSVTTKVALQKAGQEAPEHLRRNYWLGVVSGVAYNVYMVVLNTQIVVVWFLSELTTSNLLISLASPIGQGSWFFLQFLLSGYVQRKPRTMPLYRQVAVLRILVSGLLVVAAFTLGNRQALLIVFLLVFTVNSVAAGVAALPFLNVVAKTIPATRRGMYFAWRRFGGGLLGLLAGVLVKVVLAPDSGLSFPANYGVLFTVAFVLLALQVGSFSLVIEPAEAVDPRRVSLWEQLKRARRLPMHDGNYARFLVVRVAFVMSTYALPFYAVYARRELNAPEDTVGTYVLALTLSTIFANLVLGSVGDRRGNRLLVRIAAFTAMLPALTALLIALLPGFGADTVLVFSLVFLFQGLHTAASILGAGNYLLELCPSAERVLYIGLTYGIVGLAWFTLPLGSAIVDYFGYEPLFAISLVAGLVAAVFSLKLEEPREKEPQASAGGSVDPIAIQRGEDLSYPV